MDIITIRLSNANTILSKIGRFLIGSKYNHIDYIFDDGSAYSALSNGVDFNKVVPSEFLLINIEVNSKQQTEEFLINQFKKPYDWMGALGLPFGTDWQDDSKWFCFELIAAAIESNTDMFPKENHRITTKDFLQCLIHYK